MTTEHAKPHICFVAPTAWPVLARDTSVKVVGGAEVQQAFLARALAARGYRVSMICLDYGQPDGVAVDGVTVHKTHMPVSGLPLLRFFHPRLTSLWKALRKVDADIYYQRAAGAATGIVSLFARRHDKRSIYATACDLDVARHETWKLFQRRAGWRDRQLFFLGLRLADRIVVQHDGQKADCRRWFNRRATLVPSCYEAPAGASADRDGVILWVSTIKPIKQPGLFLDLARRLPQYRFRMVGGPGGEPGCAELFERIRTGAAALPNVEFLGFVPHTRIEPEFDQARVLVNTSHNEGFPNTFLQAWSRGVPTVSFCDTGSVIEGLPVSTVVKTLDEMQSQVTAIMQDDERWTIAGARARLYAANVHSIDAAVQSYERVFADLAGAALRSGATILRTKQEEA